MNTTQSVKELIAPPSDEEVAKGLERFARIVRDHYGLRLVGLFLYGSRARGDHHAESDADVAAILSGPLEYWREVRALSDLSYDELVDHGVYIDAKPYALAEWNDPSSGSNASLVRVIKRDGKPIGFGA